MADTALTDSGVNRQRSNRSGGPGKNEDAGAAKSEGEIALGMQEIEAVIPPRSNRTEAIDYDKEKYKRREKVERFFNKLKQFRRIATRYEKLSRTFMAFIHIASTWIMLR